MSDQFLNRAKELACVSHNIQRVGRGEPLTVPGDFYVVWFSKTLKNWKALVSTDVKDGLYFEVTHNGERSETYVDIYNKIWNQAVPDKT